MALTQRLDLRQTQTLVMTPQLQQAIKLLQLSNLELAAFVDGEIERNPLLERDDGDGAPDGEPALGDPPVVPAPGPADTTGTDTLARSEAIADGADGPLDTDFENVWSDGDSGGAEDGAFGSDRSGSGLRNGRTDFDDDSPDLEQTLWREVSLRDHLLGQVNMDLADPADRLIGSALVDLLDDAGYLAADLSQVAAQFGCAQAQVETVLARLQRFEPAGVFARSLSECLALQLAERNRLDPAMQALLGHLELLAQRNYAMLSRICGVDREDLADMIAELRALDPKPALTFNREVAQTIVPDILMRPQAGGGWVIELNADTLPRVLVNYRYHTAVTASVKGKAEREFIAECFASANWLVKSLHQRATTILKVAAEIVRQQDAFFAHGVQFLRPLILRDIADAIGMHESTVSRVTTNKFMATPRGVFELKYFFTTAIPGADGRISHSAEAVRFRIKSLIEKETADNVLSDDRIVEILRDDGIDIARRTVAKYREALRIPSSVQRRREKGM